MKVRRLTIELPADLLAQLGSSEELTAKAKRAFVLELLREARISQGKAAELLGVTRWEILDLAAQYRIPSGPATSDDMDEEIALARRFARENDAR